MAFIFLFLVVDDLTVFFMVLPMELVALLRYELLIIKKYYF